MKKKILICCNVYPPHFIGGAELIAHYQAKVLKKMGNDVVIFAGDHQSNGARHSMRKEYFDGLAVYRVCLTYEDFQPDYVNFFHASVERHFNDLLDSFQPDVVHFHNIVGLSIGIIHIAKRKGIRTLMTLHDHWGICYKNTLMKNDETPCRDYSRCEECQTHISDGVQRNIPLRMRKDYIEMQLDDIDVFISPSKYLADRYIEAGFPKEKFHVIWNGVDVAHFSAIRRTSNNGLVRFTFIGYFGRHKGIHVLLEALRYLPRKDRLVINLVGSGELYERYREEVRRMGLDGVVRFWGRIDDIDDAYKETDVLILPSIWPENHPVTVTEAMSAKIPVIASGNGGNPEVVQDGVTGYLFEPGNPKDLAVKMSLFLDDPEQLRLKGENAYRAIADDTLENQVEKIYAIYDLPAQGIKELNDNTILISCLGERVNEESDWALDAFTRKRVCKNDRFVMAEWLQEDQLRSSGIAWIVDDGVGPSDVPEGLRHGAALITPANNVALKAFCRNGNCGLYYEDSLESEACIAYLLENVATRSALGRNSEMYFKKWANQASFSDSGKSFVP
jgi:glycosyltransferase involved in cell wall biosynthesis